MHTIPDGRNIIVYFGQLFGKLIKVGNERLQIPRSRCQIKSPPDDILVILAAHLCRKQEINYGYLFRYYSYDEEEKKNRKINCLHGLLLV